MAFLDYFEFLAVVHVTILSPPHHLWVFLHFREEVTLQSEKVVARLVI